MPDTIERQVIPLHQGELTLDATVAERCEQRLALARTHMAAGFYHWLEAGKQFKEIKTDVGARCWAPWLRKHAISIHSADVLVRIAERFDPILVVATRIEPMLLDYEALRALAAPSVPISAAQDALNRAATGEHITRPMSLAGWPSSKH
jgi:hypothetical protein